MSIPEKYGFNCIRRSTEVFDNQTPSSKIGLLIEINVTLGKKLQGNFSAWLDLVYLKKANCCITCGSNVMFDLRWNLSLILLEPK